MDRIAVVYSSKYGHTKKYAQWLAEELSADIYDGKGVNINAFEEYSTIVFGGSLYAGTNKAAGLLVKYFEQIKDKKVVLFTCGMFDVSKESILIGIKKELDKVITPEIRKQIGIFHLRGGIDSNNLSFLHKIMVKVPYSLIKKKTENELTDEDRNFLEIYGKAIDYSDKKALDPIIQYCKQ
jgi:menaquinone-dependent protoporphyrinogen IX oxidase